VNRGSRVELWDAAAVRMRLTLGGHADPFSCLAFAPDASLLAAGNGRRIRLWDLATGRERPGLVGHTDTVAALAFSPDGRVLASGGWDRTVRVWHLATAQELLLLEGHAGPVRCVAFSQDGCILASGGLSAPAAANSSCGGQRRTPTGERAARTDEDRTPAASRGRPTAGTE
jgi:WD40 repeat protein